MTDRNRQHGGIAIWVLLAVAVVGLGSLAYGLSDADSRPDFALLTVSFLFLLGISQAGVVFTAILRLVGADWSKPWYRIAEFATLAYAPIAILGFLLIVYVAKGDLFYWLNASPEDHVSPWLSERWLVIRNLGALLLFYAVAFRYAMTSIGPDMKDDASEAEKDVAERKLYLMSPIVLTCFVLTNTFISWDFGMMLIPHFHSTVFPIHFWFGNVFAGTAAMIAIVVVMRRLDGGSHFGAHEIKSLGMMVTGFTLMWLYFFWAQFFVIWFGNLPHETEPMFRQMYGHYQPYFWTMLAGCFFIPFALYLFAFVKRSVLAMGLIAFGINLGVWINKYLMIVPVYSADNRPFDNWMDIAVALGLLSTFLLLVVLLARRYPRYAAWEMSRES